MKKLGAILIILSVISIVIIGKENVIKVDELVSNSKNQNVIDGVLLVNDNYVLDKDYKPMAFSEPNIPFVEEITNEEKQLDSIVAKAVELLVEEASKEDIILIGTSGYRSYESQKKIYEKEARKNGKKYANDYVAVPGSSEHQTGLCIDLTNEERYFVGSTKEAIWLAENAHKFGFIIRFLEGKEYITGKSYEPWHIRYVGIDKATDIYEKDITLEEYLLY